MNNYKESMVVYESAYLAINYLPDEKTKWEAMEGLLKFGFYGEIPESDNPFVNMIYVQAIPAMRSAKQRYFDAVENGKKGGRPTEVTTEEILALKKDGLSYKQITEQTGLSGDAIKKRLQRNKGTKGTNLSVSDSENESVNEYVYASEYASAYEEESNKRTIYDLSLEELRLVKQDYKDKMRYRAIAEKYNLTNFDANEFKANYSDLISQKEEEEIEQKNLFNFNQTTELSDCVSDYLI